LCAFLQQQPILSAFLQHKHPLGANIQHKDPYPASTMPNGLDLTARICTHTAIHVISRLHKNQQTIIIPVLPPQASKNAAI